VEDHKRAPRVMPVWETGALAIRPRA